LGGLSAVRVGALEYGWTEIERTQNSPLFSGLPDRFYSFSAHCEEVSVLPKGLRAFAKSSICAVQAFEAEGGYPVFGIQFHPEKDLDSGEKTLAERKKKGEPSLHLGEGKKLFDSKIGEVLYRNFFSL
jgi:GMP synthase-like glutamine amidotransferase